MVAYGSGNNSIHSNSPRPPPVYGVTPDDEFDEAPWQLLHVVSGVPVHASEVA